MLVTCLISVIVYSGGIGIQAEVQAIGRVIRQSDTNYLVDFSENLKDSYSITDYNKYSSVLVNKTNCVEE